MSSAAFLLGLNTIPEKCTFKNDFKLSGLRLLIFISAKEVMFSPVSVCLSVCLSVCQQDF